MGDFGLTSYAAGQQNIVFIRGGPVTRTSRTGLHGESDDSVAHSAKLVEWNTGHNSLQIIYPNGPINSGDTPQDDAESYA